MDDYNAADDEGHTPEINEIPDEPADASDQIINEAPRRRRAAARKAADDAPRTDFDPTWNGREPGEVM